MGFDCKLFVFLLIVWSEERMGRGALRWKEGWGREGGGGEGRGGGGGGGAAADGPSVPLEFSTQCSLISTEVQF